MVIVAPVCTTVAAGTSAATPGGGHVRHVAAVSADGDSAAARVEIVEEALLVTVAIVSGYERRTPSR